MGASDIGCAHPAHSGRAGWTWYTGAAGWLYRAGLESILGLRRGGASFVLEPCIPAAWPGFSLTWRHGRTLYVITLTNPERRSRGVARVELDGELLASRTIPLVDDGARHQVLVVLGAPRARPSATTHSSSESSRNPAMGPA